MAPSLFRRRFATAAGLYLSVGLGIVGTIAAARMLGLEDFGVFATVMAVVGLAQTLLDLTVEESLTKFGFRYLAAEDWGKLRRLFRRALELKLIGGALASLVLLALAPLADTLFGADGLTGPMVAAAALPLIASPENVSASALLLRGRYDLRGWLLSVTMAIRLVAILIGASFGVTETLAAIVVGQVVATAIAGTGWGRSRYGDSRRAERGPARGRPAGDRLVRRPVERRHRRDLATGGAHSRPARRGRGNDERGLLPDRARSAERLLGRERARPARAAHRADARLGARASRDGASWCAAILARGRGDRGRGRAGLPRRNALARAGRVRRGVPPRRRRGADRPRLGGDPARARLVEIPAGDDREATPADRDPRDRDGRAAASRRRARGPMGGHRCGGCDPDRDARVRRGVGRACWCGCAPSCARRAHVGAPTAAGP